MKTPITTKCDRCGHVDNEMRLAMHPELKRSLFLCRECWEKYLEWKKAFVTLSQTNKKGGANSN
jgi:recombinational DNA repair protein (RecF pathway)